MLSSVVLPAPLGTMTDRISPRRTSRLTRPTACTPPKDLETSAISSWALMAGSSREPPLAAPVVLDVAVALPLPDAGQPQVELLDVLVLAHRLHVAVQHHAAVLHHVHVLGEAQRHVGVLLGEQHRDALLAVEAAHDLEDLLHQHGREPHRGLVEQHEARVGHEGPADREHLLLTPRDVARVDASPVPQPREVLVDPLEV